MKYSLENQETERLRFRLFNAEDSIIWEPFFEDRSIWRFFGLDESKTVEEMNEFWWKKCQSRYQSGCGLMAVVDNKSGKLLGMCGLLIQDIHDKKRLEVGYSFLPESRGKGFATEAALFARDYAFEQGFDHDFWNSLVSTIHHENDPSIAVAKRNGMQLETEFLENEARILVYSIDRKEWERRK